MKFAMTAVFWLLIVCWVLMALFLLRLALIDWWIERKRKFNATPQPYVGLHRATQLRAQRNAAKYLVLAVICTDLGSGMVQCYDSDTGRTVVCYQVAGMTVCQ